MCKEKGFNLGFITLRSNAQPDVSFSLSSSQHNDLVAMFAFAKECLVHLHHTPKGSGVLRQILAKAVGPLLNRGVGQTNQSYHISWSGALLPGEYQEKYASIGELGIPKPLFANIRNTYRNFIATLKSLLVNLATTGPADDLAVSVGTFVLISPFCYYYLLKRRLQNE